MSEFRRFVAYIYTYENGKRGENCGFAKVELRNQIYRIQVQIKNARFPEEKEQEVCLLFRENGQIEAIKVGEMGVAQESNESMIFLGMNATELKGHFVRDAVGIFVGNDLGYYCLSNWDDGEFERGKFHRMRESELNPETESELEVESKTESEPILELEPRPESGVRPESSLELELKTKSKSEQESKSEPAPEPEQNLEMKPESFPSEPPVTVEENLNRQPGDIDQSMTEEYNEPQPMVIPEEIEEQVDRLEVAQADPSDEQAENQPINLYGRNGKRKGKKADMKDIRMLPIVPWRIGNNPFLLKGYNDFGYIVIGDCISQHPETWFIAVPGVYSREYSKIAGRFGFLEFWTEEETPLKEGMKGYWGRLL